MAKRVFSGIKPSGDLHLGNYIGAIQQWLKSQEDGFNIFCIVYMHAITEPQDPEALQQKSLELAAIFLAAGIDPQKVLLFIQSHNPDHANLAWILNCNLSMGQMNRMTQYKDKSEGKEFVSVGVFDYPALMAADILLYDTTEVPVGEDQKQHVELTRDVAERFNSKFGETFVLPEVVLPKSGARIKSLIDPTKKMSKDNPNPNSRIELLDSPHHVRVKIAAAVTDSGRDIRYDESRPGLANLIDIFSHMSGKSIETIESEFAGKGYKEFKEAVADSIIAKLEPLQARYKELRETEQLKEILRESAEKAYEISHPKLLEVYEKVGFVTL
jgi:tryptophanyl-tRNA synthetase